MTLEGIAPDQLQMTDIPRIVWIPVRDAVKMRWERNPKQHDLGSLAASFRKHGFKQVPHYDSNIGIDDGNGRVECLDWMERQGQPIIRGVATAPDGTWVMPLLVGVDDKSKALAEAYAIDANNLVLQGSDFSPWDIARLWDKDSYLSILKDLAGGDALPISVDGDSLDALLLSEGQGSVLGLDYDNALSESMARGKQFGDKVEISIILDVSKANNETVKNEFRNLCERHGLQFRMRMTK